MPLHIRKPSVIEAAGNKPKIIEEYIGRVNSSTQEVSVARMVSPEGWIEPAQTPEFNEYTVVLNGCLHIKCENNTYKVCAGEAFIALAGETVQYSTPESGGAQYVAICVPAFSPDSVHRVE